MDDDYKLYLVSELFYKELFGDKKESELFPSNWYGSDNYKLKAEIIMEAIREHKLIIDTEKYKTFE